MNRCNSVLKTHYWLTKDEVLQYVNKQVLGELKNKEDRCMITNCNSVFFIIEQVQCLYNIIRLTDQGE